MPPLPAVRTRPDRCPGVIRPWPAADGALVRIRLIGGQVPAASLAALGDVARRYGDGDLHLTSRANLQLRGLPHHAGALPAEIVEAVEATGLLPSRAHDVARNVMASPATGLAGGRTDLRGTARALDSLLCADPALAGLPGRFLFVLDDGRGDLAGTPVDLGCVALDEELLQVRVGTRGWGPVVSLGDLPAALAGLAGRFLDRRGTGPSAAWHVDELADPLVEPTPPDPRAPVASPPLPAGPGAAGDHVAVPDGRLDPSTLTALVGRADHLVVTPWRGVLVPARDGAS